MHNLATERYFKPQVANGRMASAGGPIKTLSLWGIKDSPLFLHGGRLLTLEDTADFHKIGLGTKLTAEERADPVALLRCL